MKTKLNDKILILMFAVMMVLTAFVLVPRMTGSVYADIPTTSGDCGQNVRWNYDVTTKTLTISGEGGMYDYGWDKDDTLFYHDTPWTEYNKSIEKIIVEEGVTRLGNYAFSGYMNNIINNLSEVVLPSTLVEIGQYAFNNAGINADELKVVLPQGLKSIESGAFTSSAIKRISIPKGVKKLDRTFQGSWLEQIDLCDVEELIDFTFHGCNMLTSIDLPKTLKIIDQGVFSDMPLKEIVIPEGVTTIGRRDEDEEMSAFSGCYDLERIVLPSTLTYISKYEFGVCEKLKEVDYRGTQEQWNQLIKDIDPNNSSLIDVMNNNNIKKEYNYTKDVTNITNAKIVLSETTFIYNGNVQKPEIKSVTVGSQTLAEGFDYVVSEANTASKNVGTYTITIRGIGYYIGEAGANYSIVDKESDKDIKPVDKEPDKVIKPVDKEPDKVIKTANTLTVKGRTVKLKATKLAKKNLTIKRQKAVTISKPQGKVTYKKAGVTYSKAKSVKLSKKALKKYKKKAAKKIIINASTGNITVKKGLKKGTYKVKIKVKAAGNSNFEPSPWKTVTFNIKVK